MAGIRELRDQRSSNPCVEACRLRPATLRPCSYRSRGHGSARGRCFEADFIPCLEIDLTYWPRLACVYQAKCVHGLRFRRRVELPRHMPKVPTVMVTKTSCGARPSPRGSHCNTCRRCTRCAGRSSFCSESSDALQDRADAERSSRRHRVPAVRRALWLLPLSRRLQKLVTGAESSALSPNPPERWAHIFCILARDILGLSLLPRRHRRPLGNRLIGVLRHEARDPNRTRLLLPARAELATFATSAARA